MRKSLRWIAVVLLICFVAAQFKQSATTNPPFDSGQSIEAIVRVPPDIHAILTRACADCHSNHTTWPWYSHVAPVSWFVVGHVNDGRRHVNLSTWVRPGKEPVDSIDRLNAICREVQNGEMPLTSYELIHWKAKLSPADVKDLCDWSAQERERLSNPAIRN
jgi:Haem-binding domain